LSLYISRTAAERIRKAAGGFPRPTQEDPRRRDERIVELHEAIGFAGDRLVTAFIANRVLPQPRRNRGRPAEQEIQAFVEDLHSIWLDVFDGRFRSSFDGRTGTGTGPFIRFLDRCFVEMRDAIARSRIVYSGRERPEEQQRLLESLGVSREALRNRSRHSEWRDLIARLQRIAGEVEGVL
jgi:hypothetical protein